MKRPVASLSLDLDNLWSYLKTHGEPEWKTHPTYLPVFVPLILSWLKRHHQKITFFVVGQDAAQPENAEFLSRLAEAGHEIGNHSFHHEPWMQGSGEEEVLEELSRAHREIVRVTGQAPLGFRGPGFAHSRSMLGALQQLGYQYDASILPSILGPLARLYYLWGSRMNRSERETRKGLFGRFSDGFLPLRPFLWKLTEGSLLEIPVSTIPVFRTPFHLSYVLWLSRYSRGLAIFYLKLGLWMCRMTGVEPSYLLHPLDFLGREDAPQLAFFPGMDLPRARKLELADIFMVTLKKHFEVVPMSEHARRIVAAGRLRLLEPPSDAGLRRA
ncbi:polysaccharide deacetylase family protein [bacterium]|nr:polysaccharide deacetylase family protein [bacterium]